MKVAFFLPDIFYSEPHKLVGQQIVIKMTYINYIKSTKKRKQTILLLNAFSLNMISAFPTNVKVEEISVIEAKELLTQVDQASPINSAVGHADTASVFSSVLGLDIPSNRISVSLNAGEKAVIGQYSGPRLEEGATTLPEGAVIKWLLVTVS